MKRAKVTADTFSKKPTALDKLIGSTPAPAPEPVTQEQPPTAEQSTAPERPATQRTYKPTSFYLDDMQLDKLDDLAHEYKKRTGKRINRNDIIRTLVDQTAIEDVIKLLRA